MKSNEYIKGTIKTIVLKLLSETDRMYGYEISQEVANRTNDEIRLTYGALYPILYKLQNEGLLQTTSEIVDNRARKYYSLTEDGKEVAKEKVSELQRFTESLKRILESGSGTQFSLESWSM